MEMNEKYNIDNKLLALCFSVKSPCSLCSKVFFAGFPNGRRVQDDVVDIALRAVAGGTPFTPDTNVAPNNALGDGVSQNDVPFLHRFPYLAPPQAGNNGTP